MFHNLPEQVAQGLSPQVEAVLGNSRLDLLTVGGGVALFFATSAMETLRAALNGAYRTPENRPYPLCLTISMAFVLASASSMLALTWIVLVGPRLAASFEPSMMKTILAATWVGTTLRYVLAATVLGAWLAAMHKWLAAGKRAWSVTWPGVAVSVVVWLTVAALYSYYLSFSDYTRFYAGLSQLMIALLFFQWTAVIILLGAEVNRGIIEVGKLNGGKTG
jgi:membrane protein